MTRISSLDPGYQVGDLSIYPSALDDKNILYEAKNNASTTLAQTLSPNAKIIVVYDTSSFPESGLIRISSDSGAAEFIYYGKKTFNTFQNLSRGYGQTSRTRWAKDSIVTSSVMADHHNSVKDAIINIENNLGTLKNPASTSLNGILNQQEVRFLSPKPIFRAFPRSGPVPLTVRFQDFSTGDLIRYYWEFGDGATSLEESPTHVYTQEGSYTVKLTITNSTGGVGLVTKTDYITVDNNVVTPFFYLEPTLTNYSIATAARLSTNPTTFKFIDQTDGDIIQRNWIFGDGTTYVANDPNEHTVSHVYASPSNSSGYIVNLLITFSNNKNIRINLPGNLIVS